MIHVEQEVWAFTDVVTLTWIIIEPLGMEDNFPAGTEASSYTNSQTHPSSYTFPLPSTR
jgi:hypothetical protein